MRLVEYEYHLLYREQLYFIEGEVGDENSLLIVLSHLHDEIEEEEEEDLPELE